MISLVVWGLLLNSMRITPNELQLLDYVYPGYTNKLMSSWLCNYYPRKNLLDIFWSSITIPFDQGSCKWFCAGSRISIDAWAWLVCRVIEVTGQLVLADTCCLPYRLSDTSPAVSRVVFDPQNRFKVVETGDFIFSHQTVSWGIQSPFFGHRGRYRQQVYYMQGHSGVA